MIRLRITGKVQGVGFRAITQKVAKEMGLNCTAKNLEDGSVEVTLEGTEEISRTLISAICAHPGAHRIDQVFIEKEKG